MACDIDSSDRYRPDVKGSRECCWQRCRVISREKKDDAHSAFLKSDRFWSEVQWNCTQQQQFLGRLKGPEEGTGRYVTVLSSLRGQTPLLPPGGMADRRFLTSELSRRVLVPLSSVPMTVQWSLLSYLVWQRLSHFQFHVGCYWMGPQNLKAQFFMPSTCLRYHYLTQTSCWKYGKPVFQSCKPLISSLFAGEHAVGSGSLWEKGVLN